MVCSKDQYHSHGQPAKKATLEIETLTNVISSCQREVEVKEGMLDLDKERDFKKKISERFAEYEPAWNMHSTGLCR